MTRLSQWGGTSPNDDNSFSISPDKQRSSKNASKLGSKTPVIEEEESSEKSEIMDIPFEDHLDCNPDDDTQKS